MFVGRSENPRGPFVDRDGDTLSESPVGGTRVIQPNGNTWVGAGHNSIATDLAGQDWLVYHAIDRRDPFLEEPFGVNQRPMLIDRLDWIDGWPTVRAGRWASETPQPAPVTDGLLNDSFNRGTSLVRGWEHEGGAWRLVKEANGEGYVRQQSSSDREGFLIGRAALSPDVRAEADLRFAGGTAAGVVVRYKNENKYAVAWLDRRANALVTDVVVGGQSLGRQSTALPDEFDFENWHNVAVEVRGSEMTVEVTDARLNDPYAVAKRILPSALLGERAGVASRGGRIEADNFSAVELYTPHTDVAEPPAVGTLLPEYSDEFDDGELEPEWSWVRGPAGEETDGVYRWPTQDADLFGENNSASVLLRDAPEGRYTVETKLAIDLGVNTDRSFQQAGMVVYINDDHHLRLTHVAIFTTRQTEFLKEMPFADGISSGSMSIGPPADVTWLRITHRRDPANGEHEFRAATSRGGKQWVWGGVWTLPAHTSPRIGLVSMGGSGATAEFDYFRVYRP